MNSQKRSYWGVFCRNHTKNSCAWDEKDENEVLVASYETEREAMLQCLFKLHKEGMTFGPDTQFIQEKHKISQFFLYSDQEMRNILANSGNNYSVAQIFIHSYEKILPSQRIPTTNFMDVECTFKKRKREIDTDSLPDNAIEVMNPASNAQPFSELFVKSVKRRKVLSSSNSETQKKQLEITKSEKEAKKPPKIEQKHPEISKTPQKQETIPSNMIDSLFREAQSQAHSILDDFFELEVNYCENSSKTDKERPNFLKRKDFFHSKEVFERLISQYNHVASKYYLGCLLSWGYLGDEQHARGLKICNKSGNQAIPYLEKKAASGDKNFQWILGRIYSNGHGTPMNDKKAYELFKSSAEQGSARGLFNYGFLHLDGRAVPRNVSMWVQTLFKGAEQGYVPALFHIGHEFLRGQKMPQDIPRAFECLKKCVKEGYPPALSLLAEIYLMRPALLSEKRHEEFYCERKAIQCLQMGNQIGDCRSQLMLANIYSIGIGALVPVQNPVGNAPAPAVMQIFLKSNREKALHYLKLAGKGGLPPALTGLAVCMLQGKETSGVKQDKFLAHQYFKAANQPIQAARMVENGMVDPTEEAEERKKHLFSEI